MSRTGDRKLIGEGRYLRLVDVGSWEWTERKRSQGVVAVAALTCDDELVLVEQYRPALACPVYELPAGLVGDEARFRGEARLDAARRELLEETGFEASSWSHLLDTPTSAGLTNEMVSLFAARNLTRVGPGGGDESEEIRVHLLPLAGLVSELRTRASAGAQIDSKIFAALYLLNSSH